MEYADYLQDFENYLAVNEWPDHPAGLYQPVQDILATGGKRFRPVLCLMGCHLAQGNLKDALPVALALEVFHNFTLMHDDIMDEASQRRGQPTTHIKYGLNAAILSGDVMLIHSYQILQEHVRHHTNASYILQRFTQIAREVCEGQQMDINFETNPDVTQSEYIQMIKLKTAVLLGGALEMGALIGGASPEEAAPLRSFGELAGIAFQIQDDWLDTYGQQLNVGKTIGGDILQAKKTILYILARESANNSDREMLYLMYSSNTTKTKRLEETLRIFEKLHVSKQVAILKNKILHDALNALESSSYHSQTIVQLKQLAMNMSTRTK